MRELLGAAVSDVRSGKRQHVFRYVSADAFIEVMSTYYGPMVTACDALERPERQALIGELAELAEQHNSTPGTALRLPSTYLEVVATVA